MHKEDPGRFIGQRPIGSDDNFGFNPSGKLGSGNDPLNSVLEALGHSPEAAEKFFTDAPTKYNEDGTVDRNGEPGFKSYLSEFTREDFRWNVDRNDSNLFGADDAKEALNDGPNALGHALEAATSGRPYDSDATADAIKHTPERAALTEKIVAAFGENPELIRRNENGDIGQDSGPLYALRDSLGDIAAEYMGDFQRSMYEDHEDTETFPPFGAAANFADTGQVQRFWPRWVRTLMRTRPSLRHSRPTPPSESTMSSMVTASRRLHSTDGSATRWRRAPSWPES